MLIRRRWSVWGVALVCACTPVRTSPVADAPSMFAGGGPAATSIEGLWWGMLAASVVVMALVFGLLGWALWRRRSVSWPSVAPRGEPERPLPGGERTWVVGGGFVLPTLVLTGVLAATLATMRSLADLRPTPEVVIEVIGHQFWWEVHYPNHGFVTANEIHIPVGQPIELRLTSADVIHSLWVPALNGKTDLIPGRTTTLILQADQVADFLGECAEFCGPQHAKMRLVVVAEAPDSFETWTQAQQQPGVAPETPEQALGQQVFTSAACVYCHTIRGSAAAGTLGPDLTHLASRRTLGAGIMPNTRGHLAGWILDPQSLKPGNLMPATTLSGPDLNALLAYLEHLK